MIDPTPPGSARLSASERWRRRQLKRPIWHELIPTRFGSGEVRVPMLILVTLTALSGVAFLRRRNRQILGPRRHCGKLADGLRRYFDVRVDLDPDDYRCAKRPDLPAEIERARKYVGLHAD